jgi:hypothetical protein
MNVLFWFLWVCNLLILILAIAGGSFRGEMSLSTDFNTWSAALLILTTIGSLVLRFVFKLPFWSLIAVAIPILIAFLMYLIDKSKKTSV